MYIYVQFSVTFFYIWNITKKIQLCFILEIHIDVYIYNFTNINYIYLRVCKLICWELLCPKSVHQLLILNIQTVS